jgi:membrane-associated phospholipid phosphatase
MAEGAADTAVRRREGLADRPGAWHPLALALGLVLSAALLASWFVEPTRSAWLTLDEAVFRAFNETLASGRLWQGFWAIANSRLGDILSALMMIGVYLHFMFRQGREARTRIFAVGVLLAGLVIIAQQLGKALPVQRLSATLLHPDALRLSELVTWIATKDHSGDTFPGDHGSVLIICAGVITFYLPRAYAVAAWLLAAFWVLPRMVAGAHWMTDDLVGSLAIAGAVLTVALATPLHRIVVDRLEGLLDRIRRRF